MTKTSFTQARPVWSEDEAIVAVLLSAATADGDIGAVEREEMLAFEHRSKLLKRLSARRLSQLNREVTQRLRYGEGSLAQACAVLPEHARAPIFALALDIMLADGDLSGGEADFIKTLLLQLKLDEARAESIAEVISLKNQV